ncbi:MAG: hypothetical protein IJ174_00805 [Clostridia bacterium]|nr:hypothetical protein [Clostridia bacterium]
MKKLISLFLALILTASLICTAAMADEVPQPEGGKKFESAWAITGMVVRIDYEEEGYRVAVTSENPEEGKGTEWAYNCYYHAEDDTLVSVSSSKYAYTFPPVLPTDDEFDPDRMTNQGADRTFGAAEYDGLDEDDKVSVFSIDENGRLLWKDGHENAGADLEFIRIGSFSGSWKNDDEGVSVTFAWNGREDKFYYNVVIQRFSENFESYSLFAMTGLYNEETAKLECSGSVWSMNSEGMLATDGETYDAFFSMMENGNILYEAANGIELEPDFDL